MKKPTLLKPSELAARWNISAGAVGYELANQNIPAIAIGAARKARRVSLEIIEAIENPTATPSGITPAVLQRLRLRLGVIRPKARPSLSDALAMVAAARVDGMQTASQIAERFKLDDARLVKQLGQWRLGRSIGFVKLPRTNTYAYDLPAVAEVVARLIHAGAIAKW